MRRSRTIAAPVDAVWQVAGDPHHRPRWWPGTRRVEGVTPTGWTSVFVTPRGRTVRADFSVVETEPPALARWRQELTGTPFERLFACVEHELRLAPAGADGTRVELTVEQRATGWARLGAMQLRRATRRQLDEALAALAGLVA